MAEKSWWVSFRGKLYDAAESVAVSQIVTKLLSLMKK
ncbi:MAG: hypothetical protein H6Q69_1791 [Firmicutes bacterium]|nr:hypothetical protein [Bacillota bacterium]